ncbi:MAG TPA: putative 2OG-Fe(II) oxygenase [Rhizomicrobium sp.]|jgi:uncharacterized protein (TIGR02466 family)|nr:putative 2OG-Fe(II) oxygenase [Rhizomicrobium sp.]
MAVVSHEVHPLFVEPYFRASIAGSITSRQIEFIQSLKMVNNMENLISENLYIFEEPELKSIKDAVQEALDIYAQDVMCIPQSLYVTQSWSLSNSPNVGMHGHSHSNSVLSGSLYYCELPSPLAGMVFTRHVTYQQIDLLPERDKRNIYNSPINRIIPKQNDLILFSSRLTHMVEPNPSNRPRHAIAFNTFVKGKLGNYRDVSELML